MNQINPGQKRLSKLSLGVLMALLLAIFSSACDSGDLLDLALDPPSRKPIDVSKVGVNNFFVNPEFGSIRSQWSEIKNTLGLKYVRVLIAWTNESQPSPDSSFNYSFYDEVFSSIPSGVEVNVVLSHMPDWMTNSSNWTTRGNVRLSYIDRFVRPTVQRYANVRGITSWEIFNEPDIVTVPADAALGLSDPANYTEMLAYGYNVVKSEDPSALVIMAASQSIQQNFPTNLDYNKRLKELGVENVTDVWNIHFYGTRYEAVVNKDGVRDFLNSVRKPIWVTESGEQGPNRQLPYVETAWPFLSEEIPGIQRFYYYQFGETTPLDINYGLRTTSPDFPVSDFYIFLRDR